MGPAEFFFKYWDWGLLTFLILNTIFQKLEWKGAQDILGLIWGGIKSLVITKPGKLPMLFIGLFLLIPSLALANPFLVCDPQTNVTHYVVTIDGNTTTVLAFDLGDGTVMLKYDLAGISVDTHSTEVKAKNIWDESVAVPFVFVKAIPGVPTAIRIE